KTTSIPMLAYLWFLLEHNVSILICGGVSTGKCISPDDYIQLADGEILRAEELHEKAIKNKAPVNLLTLSDNPLKIEPVRVNKFWRMDSDKLFTVSTNRGISISATPEHPFFCMRDGEIIQIRADKLKPGDILASVRRVPIKGKTQNINMMEYETGIYTRDAKPLLNRIMKSYGFSKKDASKKMNINYLTFNSWFGQNAIPLKELKRFLEITNYNKDVQIKRLSSRRSSKNIRNITKTSPELASILGYVIGDGNIDKNTTNFHNSNHVLRKRFSYLVKDVFGIGTTTQHFESRTSRVQIYSFVVSEILNKVFGIPNRKKSRNADIPKLILKSSSREVSYFLSALFDCESYVSNKECEIEFSTSSEKLAKKIPYLLQRFGIISKVSTKKINGKKYYRLMISGSDNLKLFKENIGYSHPEKKRRLDRILRKTKNYITNVDLVPVNKVIRDICQHHGINNTQLAKNTYLKRESIRDIINERVRPQRQTLKKIACGFEKIGLNDLRVKYLMFLAESDIMWDKVKEVKPHKNKKGFVYDVTVDGTHNFVAGNFGGLVVSNTTYLNILSMFIHPEKKIVSIEDTREINLSHENWIPSVARTGFGMPEASGKRYGEVDMFDLLKESFRMNPDYIIVGEIRGKEAYVMFQGMSSGHPSIGTMHAGSIEDVIKRLESPPIELSTSLIESLDILIVMTSSSEKGKSVRRVKEVVEIQSIDSKTGKAHAIRTFNWIPATDKFKDSMQNSEILRRISFETGTPYSQIVKEIETRKKVLEWMERNGIYQFAEVADILNLYYKEPKIVMKWVEDNKLPSRAQLQAKLKKRWESSTELEFISD
ncbi:MAG: Flp pilus assembly complex ATPase component TadA, partial [Nanoarchaeota archaeon]|nr:Flp pilus assembly complex ATPase component TadA [Nanoarchaeota archaeon]